jgi:hypothetical protein
MLLAEDVQCVPTVILPREAGKGDHPAQQGGGRGDGRNASSAAACPLHHASRGPLPRAARGGGQNKFVLAASLRARAMPTTTPRKDSPPATKGGRSAERRIVLPIAACAAAHPDQMRPPSGASPRHSPPALTPMAQPQNRVSRHLELAGVLPAYILASVKRAPRGPVLLPVDRYPRAARERIAFIRARGPHSLRLSGMPAGQTPLR